MAATNTPAPRKAEIVSIGSELTSGANLDTNSQWLSRKLAEIGVQTGWHSTIPDDHEVNLNSFRLAASRAGLVIISGGLGPTQDDLTRETMAKLAGVDLLFDEPSWQAIQEMFTRRNRVCPERNRVQALFPKGSEPLPNSNGTAPGIFMIHNGTILVALPGPPREMELMWKNEVEPRLLKADLGKLGLGGGFLARRTIRTFGAGESAVEEKLLDLTKRGAEPEVGITASNAIISLSITARGETPAEAQSHIAPIEATIRERLGELVFGADNDTLQEAVASLLEELKLSVSLAESITCGRAASLLGAVPGISEWLAGSLVVYQAKAKERLLGYPKHLLETEDCVGPETAKFLAKSVRERLGTDIGVAVVGYAGPGDGGPGKPAGLVFAAVDDGTEISSEHTQHWHGSRSEIQHRTALMTLNLLRLRLLAKKSATPKNPLQSSVNSKESR
jgi:nicotinamide-nucleotide amidase